MVSIILGTLFGAVNTILVLPRAFEGFEEGWGLIKVFDTKIAFVVSHQHPPHICFEVDEEYVVNNLGDKKFKKHRDGTESCYITDCDGNFIEFLKCQNRTS